MKKPRNQNMNEQSSSIVLKVKLEASAHRDGTVWIDCCPPIDVATQADSKRAALLALEEAVHLWFDSCIDRGVLEEALTEAGFKKLNHDGLPPEGASIVELKTTRGKMRPVPEYVEVSIPAYIAANYLGHCAAH
jgi:predicted RNase H-like HicB family nuclease